MLFRIVLPLLLAAAAPLAFAAKTDVVILTNGDKVTGEVKRLEAARLEFSTDTMGTVFIEWRFIRQVISDRTQTVETIDGRRLTGRLSKSESGEGIVLATAQGALELDPGELVSAWPVEATLLDKLDVDLSVGLDYAKSTDITNFYLSTDAKYTTADRFTDFVGRTQLTNQPGGEDQVRNQYTLTHQYFLPERRFRVYTGAAETNDALGIDLRLSAGLGFGRYFSKTNTVWFSGSAGVVATQETPSEGATQENLEGVLSVQYRYFRFAEPERSLDVLLSVYPSLTDTGRYRADFRNTFKLEFFRDLFWAMELYASYDSEPLSEGAEKSDYGITTSVGWSY